MVKINRTVLHDSVPTFNRFSAGGVVRTINDLFMDVEDNIWKFNGDTPHFVQPHTQPQSPLWSLVTRSSFKIETGSVSILEFGAIAGQDCTDAFKKALETGKAITIPDTSYDKPYIITSDVQLPLVSRVLGTSPAFPIGYEERYGFTGSYIQFDGGRFLGGTGPNDRVFMYWGDLMFFGKHGANVEDKGLLSNAGTAFSGSIGGYINNVSFAGLEYGMVNPDAYSLNISNVRANNNYWVFKLDDFNSSSIENYFGSYNNIHIDLGADAARSTLRNIGINMNTHTELGIRFEGGVSLDGYIYFENFGTPASGSCCLAINFGRFSNRSVDVSNVLFHADRCDYCLSLGATTNQPVRISGTLSNCDWYTPKIAKVGYGVVSRFNGESTYPTAVIKNVPFSTHNGLSLTDLQKPDNSPYKKWIQGSRTSWRIVQTLPITRSISNIPLSGSAVTSTNVESTYNAGGIELPTSGTYMFNGTVTINNNTSEFVRTVKVDLRHKGGIIDSSLCSVQPRVSSGASYNTVAVSGTFEGVIGDSVSITVAGDGGSVYSAAFNLVNLTSD